MKKVLISALLLGLLIAIPAVNADSHGVNFQITVEEDWTIMMPALCESGGSVENTLEFNPGITLVNETGARPIDSCATDTIGDYSVENDGNVVIRLGFSLDNDPAAGIMVVVGGSEQYSVGEYSARLNTTVQYPVFAQNLSPLTGNDILQIWQRVGVDDTVTGGSELPMQLIITSMKQS